MLSKNILNYLNTLMVGPSLETGAFTHSLQNYQL